MSDSRVCVAPWTGRYASCQLPRSVAALAAIASIATIALVSQTRGVAMEPGCTLHGLVRLH